MKLSSCSMIHHYCYSFLDCLGSKKFRPQECWIIRVWWIMLYILHYGDKNLLKGSYIIIIIKETHTILLYFLLTRKLIISKFNCLLSLISFQFFFLFKSLIRKHENPKNSPAMPQLKECELLLRALKCSNLVLWWVQNFLLGIAKK